jgi:hypothetical protein
LLLPAAQIGRRSILKPFEPDHGQSGFSPLPLFLRAQLHFTQGIANIFHDRHVRPDGVGLKYHADFSLVHRDENSSLRGNHHSIADTDFAVVGPLESGETAQRRGLAAAARSEQRHQLSRWHLEVNSVDRANQPLFTGIVFR